MQIDFEEWPLRWSRATRNDVHPLASFFFLFSFRLAPIPSHSRSFCEPLLSATSSSARSESENTDEDGGENRETNRSDIGRDRANPRTTARWTTWRHVASGIAAPKSRGKSNCWPKSERDREEISSLLGTWRTSTDSTKRFRSFDIPNSPRSCSFCRPSAPSPSAALKRRVFARGWDAQQTMLPTRVGAY